MLLTVLHTAALAQGVADTPSPYPGTVQAGLFDSAPADNRRVFGVASYLDSTILPRMASFEGPFVVADTNSILGVTRAASTNCWQIAPDGWGGDSCTVPMDLGASQVGIGYSWRYGGIFYGATYTTAYVAESTVDRMVWTEALIPGMALVAPYVAPLVVGPAGVLSEVDDGLFGRSMEYTVGGRLSLPIGDDEIAAHVAFLAGPDENGFITSLTEAQVRLLLTLAVQEEALPYLMGGLSRSPFVFRAADSLGDWPMLSSLFVRKLDLPRPAGEAETVAATEAAIPFWTGHVEQYNLGPVDVRAAVSWEPTVSVHALLVTVHTADFNPSYDDEGDFWDMDLEPAFGITAGVVSVPPAYYLAAPGGPSPHVEAELRLPHGSLAFTMNHPDTLVAFPYAQNAFHVSGKLRL